MAIVLNDNVNFRAPKPADDRYLNSSAQPYSNTAAAVAAIPVAYRFKGLTVNIGTDEYWWKTGTADTDLILKTSGGGGFSNPMTTQGDLIVGGASGTPQRLGIGTALQQIRVNAAGTALEYFSGGSGITFKEQAFTADGSTSTFVVSNGTLDQISFVDVNGNVQLKGTNYTVSGQNVAFGSAVPSGMIVTVHYAEGTGGGTGGGGTWGSITGTLSAQTDLQSALNLKAPLASPTFTGKVTLPTTSTSSASFNIGTTGANVTSPVFGDIWLGNTPQVLKVYKTGGTYQIITDFDIQTLYNKSFDGASSRWTFSGDATGDMIYKSSPSNMSRLGIGSLNQVLTVVSDGLGGFIPSWQNATGGSPSLGTITDDPFHYPASGNSLDTFGGRTSGNLKSIFGSYSLPTVTGLNMKIVSDGNSNSVGYNLPAGQDYPTQVYNALGGSSAGYSIVNFGVSGQTTQNMQSDAATQIDPAFDGSKTKNFLFAWEVENDVYVNGVSGATASTNMLNYWSGRKSTGYYVIGATSPLRGNDTTVNNKIKTANTALLAGTSNYDAIVDIPSIPMLSNVRASGFQSDLTHFTFSGVLALRDAYVSKVRTALSQQDYTPPNFMSWNGNTPDRSMIVGPTNSNALSFITNGKIRAEVTPNGSLTSVGDVTAVNGLAIGLTVNPGLTASADGDNLMTALFKPAYFDTNGKSSIVKDIVQFRDSANVIQSRWDDRGRFFLQPTFTALNNNDQGSVMTGTTTGFSSGTFTGLSIAPNHNYAGNSTRFTAVDISPTANVGSYTGTLTTVLKVNAGAFVTSADKALEIDANDGVGLYINHGGSTYAANISSSTAGTIAAIGGTNGSALALNCYKIDGTGQTALFQNLTGSSVSSTIPIITLSRPVTINNGGGIAFPYIMGSSTGSIRTAGQSSAYWIDNTNTSETGGMKWETMQSGTLSEGMKLEGKNLTVDGTITATGGSYITPTSQAGGRNLAIADNGTLIVTSNSSPISITIPTGLAVGFNCKVAQGSSGAVTVSGAGGTTVVGGTAGTAITANAGDIVEVYCTGTNTYLINLH